jgi:hypothetical protein
MSDVKRDAYAYDQNSGCAAKIYKADDEAGGDYLLYHEIQACRCERSVEDINGSFSMTLLPTRPWDELINPDSFIRIFMGDKISSHDINDSHFNIASGFIGIDINSNFAYLGDSSVLPIPVYGNGTQKRIKKASFLLMYERFFGKIDRVERVEHQTESGPRVMFQVSGRSFGSIIQDITLYYNENIAGLNAVNVFYGTTIPYIASPDEIIRELLTTILTAVPFPQWQIPTSLARDLDNEVVKENLEIAEKTIDAFLKRIEEAPESTRKQNTNFMDNIKTLLKSAKNSGSKSIFAYLSLKSIKPTAGKNFNRSFMTAQSSTTGFFELLKGLTNEFMNEFWFDMCPNGVANDEALSYTNGRSEIARNIPTVVFRQRPYNIAKGMTQNVADYLISPTETLNDSFKEEQTGVSLSLLELMPSAFTIMGATDRVNSPAILNDKLEQIIGKATSYTPTVLNYSVGRSGHDRHNGFCVLPMQSEQISQMTVRILSADAGGIIIDPVSIKKYGFRMMELQSFYVQSGQKSDEEESTFQSLLASFSKTIANWYYLNPYFLNGSITCRFLPEARIGVPCRYIKTRIDDVNRYPKIELFYVQALVDEYTYGAQITTTLTVIRGIRYNLETQNEFETSDLGSSNNNNGIMNA